MSWLKFSLVLSTGVLLVGLVQHGRPCRKTPRRPATAATAGTAAPCQAALPVPRRPGRCAVGRNRRAAMRMDLPARRRCAVTPAATSRNRRRGANPRRPPGPAGQIAIDGPRRKVPAARARMVRRRGGPEGDRPQPPGPPPGYPPRGREDFESLKTKDPELFKAIQEDRDLERQTRDQADQYRRAGKDEQAKIKEKLVEIVNKHFEVRQQLRNLEVKRLEQQLKQLRDKIDQRAKNRKEIVEKRIIELTGADEGEHF